MLAKVEQKNQILAFLICEVQNMAEVVING